MVKLTKRKVFKFFRSYYDVFNELSDRDKLIFIKALLDKQFHGVEPTNLKGAAKLAWISQMHSIDQQVKGYQDKTGNILTPSTPPSTGGITPPSLQEEVKEEVKEEYTFSMFWDLYDKKINRKKCLAKWTLISDGEKEKILKTLPEFLRSIKDKQYQPHPLTYLNGERWNDVIESSSNYPSKYDSQFERGLEGNEIMKYHKHLIGLGWEKMYGSSGTTWKAPK